MNHNLLKYLKDSASGVTPESIASAVGDYLTENPPTVAGDDTAYDAGTWNLSQGVPTKNAVRDKIVTIDSALDGKVDKVEGSSLVADTAIANFHAPESDNQDLSGKQDVLVSGSNIKTINSTSILGSGDIPTGGPIHVSKSEGATTTGANTTPVSVTGAVFSYVANSVYRIWVMGRINSSAATTGIGIQFDLSSAVTAINSFTIHNLAVATVGGQSSIADDTSQGVTTGVPAGPLDVPFLTNCLLVTGANTGTCQLRLRSETTAVTELMAGTVMVVEKLA